MSTLSKKQTYWHEILERYRLSKKTQQDFCHEAGINYGTFKYYFYKKSKKTKSVSHASPNKEKFSKVSLSGLKNGCYYQAILPNGVRCYIPQGFKKPEVQMLLEVLSQC